MVLAGDGLTATHEIFSLLLGHRADQAQLEAADQPRIRLNAGGDGLRIDIFHSCDIRHAWHSMCVAADIDKGEHTGLGARQDMGRKDPDVCHPYRSAVEHRGNTSMHAYDIRLAAFHADPKGRGTV